MSNKMKVTDLRIGDLILDKRDNTVRKVELLASDNVTFVLNSDDAAPIPLTEEWWLKLGGSAKTETEWGKIVVGKYIAYFNHDILQIELNDKFGGIVYKKVNDIYVHTLQNIIHALTNQELTTND